MFCHLITVLALATVISAACYDIHGTLITDADFVPCNNVLGVFSMCCANRAASSALTSDTCLPNGLCKSVFTNSTTNKPDTVYWREGCSDSQWGSPYCLKGICASSSDVDGGNNAVMTPCDGTPESAKWCCGTHNMDCCGTGKEILLAAVVGAATTSSSASESSSTSTASTTPSSTPAPGSALSTGAKAGIGIGCGALAGLVAGAIFYFWRKKRSLRADNLRADNLRADTLMTEYAAGSYQDGAKVELQEMPDHVLLEMQGMG